MLFTRLAAIVVLLIGAEALAQNSRAVLTGIVYDPEGIGLSGVTVMAERAGTKTKYQTQSTPTGNYAFPELPVGKYVVSISKPGFQPYASSEISLSATQTVRFDIALEAEKKEIKGEKAEEEEEESGEEYYIELMSRIDGSQWAHIVSGETLKNLPMLGFSYGEGRLRNPLSALWLTPGTQMGGRQYFNVSGAPDDTGSMRIEGQDANNGIMRSRTTVIQPGVDAIEEFSIQTGNYPAEYGQALGGIVNTAMKSGTNAYHGSLYTYWTHEALNEPNYYTGSKPEDRRYNYGAALGGPIFIPRIYDGHDRTFVFLNFEQLRQEYIAEKAFTVPTLAFRRGDFRQALTGRRLGTDALGRTIQEGAIYNPASERVVNGVRIRNPFSSNIIPTTQFDSVARTIQNLIPRPTDTDNTHVTNNYVVPWTSPRLDSIGSLKLDHSFGRSKLSFYYGINVSDSSQSTEDGGDGIEDAITGGKDVYTRAQTYRLNYERSLSPTRTLHVGLGYQGLKWDQKSAYGNYDLEGLTGSNLSYFPYISGLTAVRGGAKDLGSNTLGLSKMENPSANANMTWVRGKHIFKFGGELRIEGYSSVSQYPAYGSLTFSAEQTMLPSAYGQYLDGGTLGFPYASFLLGLVDSGDIGVVSSPRLGKHGFAFFAQDNWKLSRRLTFEYGLRYDYQTYLKNGRGRIANFSPTALNPTAGDLPGAMVYEGSGAGGCNCDFADIYKKAFGPRFGIAYQMTDNYILRAGFSVMYGQTATDNGATLASGSTNPFFSTTFANAARKLSAGFPSARPWPDPDINQTYIGSGISPLAIHPDAGRPPRQIQWSLAIQRQMGWKMLLEIAYVGNRGTGWESNGYANLNALTTSALEDLDLDITNADDRALLLSTLNSSLASQKGYTAPYPGFPTTETVAQSLRPFPQYGDILYRWAPIGKTWYDSVQVKVTKQYSSGIAFTGGFSWQKEYSAGMESEGAIIAAESIDDSSELEAQKHVSPLSRPLTYYFAPTYTFPKLGGNKYLSMALSDWQFGAMLQYSSGFPIRVPNANNNLHLLIFQTTLANRGLNRYFLKNPDDRDLNPREDFMLDPDAWTDPQEGQFSPLKPYRDDYRLGRLSSEQISFGRTFRINDKLRVHGRIEFQNIANRRNVATPYYINAKALQIKDDDGEPQSGFGYMSYRDSGRNPRTGQVVVRLEF